MIYYKTAEEIEAIRESNLLVSATIAEVAKHIKPGVTTLFLDRIADEFIQKNNAKAAFKGYRGFPFTCCMSVNSAVVHGFASDIPLQVGDVLSVDVGVIKNDFVGDSAYTFAVGEVSSEIAELLRVTKQSLYKGIEKAVVGNRIGDISWAIQAYTEKQHGYGVVRELTGHGVGKKLHEDPEVPNYGRRGNGLKLQEGLVIAIEPMINLGKKDVYVADDDWTILTQDGKASAHFEHSIAIKKNRADILSSFEDIEMVEQQNEFLTYVH